MQTVEERLAALKSSLPPYIKIVAVSKTKPPEMIMEAYGSGHRMFGENRVQELISKREKLPRDIEWHQIGHLQSNKVRYIVPFVSMIESVDSYRLLRIIDREAERSGRVIDCLLQVHIATEDTKFGFSIDEIREMLNNETFMLLKNIRIRGLMGMATFTDDMSVVRTEFRQLRRWFEQIRDDYFNGDTDFNEVSMGMSGDYMVAVEEGSTIIRVGSLIFGER
ncbi:MAG: YggS family pyridoxal phosphate-dependent enzyme [Bacteroidales bacterium]|nr:YggS family pyridoxal phosphate-dependent enzyme [Bacteroidales bacterium]